MIPLALAHNYGGLRGRMKHAYIVSMETVSPGTLEAMGRQWADRIKENSVVYTELRSGPRVRPSVSKR